MRSKLFFLICFLFFTKAGHAQIFMGGNAGVSFSNGNSYLELSPTVGYAVDNLRLGVSPVAYYTFRSSNSDLSYGGRIFAQYSIWQNIYAHAGLESLNTKVYSYVEGVPDRREWLVGLPIGLGLNSNISEHLILQTTVLYNVLHKDASPQNNPYIRAGLVYQFK